MIDNSEYLQMPGMKLMRWLRDAELSPAEPIGDQEVTELPGEPPPRFPTGLPAWDDKTGGGGYGCTCIAGMPKCGKTMLAQSCGIEAAQDNKPWRVLYFNAELSRFETINRVRNYLGSEATQRLQDLAKQLSFHPSELGISPSHVFRKVGERIELQDERLLLVFDSLNRIVSQSQQSESDHSYWATMRKWIELCRMAAKLSGGRVASVVVSELAAAGHAKGREIEYAADLVVKITAASDPEYFEIGIPYARSSAAGPLGKFWLDWKRGRFVHIGE